MSIPAAEAFDCSVKAVELELLLVCGKAGVGSFLVRKKKILQLTNYSYLRAFQSVQPSTAWELRK
jgi:hypothetical protein